MNAVVVREQVEILPDLYVEQAVARRLQALLVTLVVLFALWLAQDALPLPDADWLEEQPLFDALAAPPPPPAAVPSARLAYLERFNAARKRALEVLPFAVAAAGTAVPVTAARLTSDPAATLSASGYRLHLTLAGADSPAVRTYLANLRAVVPGARLAAGAAPGTLAVEGGEAP